MSPARFRKAFGWALATAFVTALGTAALAQDNFVAADQQPAGKIVPITPGGGANLPLGETLNDQLQVDQQAPPELPRHWIGILLGPVADPVRAQIDIPADEGVMVRQVMPDSPAAKAGLETFDILLKANDATLANPQDLMDLVRQVGADGGQITLDVLRRGQHQSVVLTPEPRPEPSGIVGQNISPEQGWGMGGAMRGMPAMPRFNSGSNPLPFRMMPPMPQGFALSQVPNGISVNIQKQNDEPAHITVQRGNDSWEIIGDDPASLEQLPEDVRAFVERLLAESKGSSFEMPMLPRMPVLPDFGSAGFEDDTMQQQLHRMEQQLQQMRLMLQHDLEQPQIEGSSTSPPDTDSN